MNIRRDVAAGLFFTVIGLSALLMAVNYPFGTTFNMGPGYFPIIVSGLMLVLGVLLTITAFRANAGPLLNDIAWRPLIIILVAVVGFALLIDRGGMLPALAFLTIVGWYANPNRNLKVLPIQFLVSILVPVLIFRVALGMPIPLWRF
ncbi:tripartite tricarboxylate transporter TctB family protein [Aureimonas fodinaquatilis]|uniref:tripartite tricarboxylate transporter TctB family protein n=1 Tax=Aureimonas fodinaquatilis TaxID=2565783 RepID=UPI00165DB41F|nr:tripartite tricarboxylate transporter TctB family protein [Aureimonas fodinaquatilis]